MITQCSLCSKALQPNDAVVQVWPFRSWLRTTPHGTEIGDRLVCAEHLIVRVPS